MIRALQGLLEIESVSGGGSERYPYGEGPAKALDYVLSLSESFGFRTKNAQYRYGYAEIGQGEQMIGILTHLDTVPAGDGWDYPPFAGTVAQGKLYGRGTLDDKGPTVASIFAMKEILDSGVPLNKRIRIIFGQDEETGDWKDLKAYKEVEEMPDCGFTPDGSFPAIYGEKGVMIAGLSMDLKTSGFEDIDGGTAPNMVADFCTAVVNGRAYQSHGKSAHGSMPWEGENAITKLMTELCEGDGAPTFARAYMNLMGGSLCGELMNCDVSDEASGGLTMNAGRIEVAEGKVNLYLDIRYPVTFSDEELLKRIREAAMPYGMEVWCRHLMKPVYMDKDGEVIRCLVESYRKVTGDKTQPMVVGGCSYARAMKNIVAFGPGFPEKPCTEHERNEYIPLEDLAQLTEIYREALMALVKIKVL